MDQSPHGHQSHLALRPDFLRPRPASIHYSLSSAKEGNGVPERVWIPGARQHGVIETRFRATGAFTHPETLEPERVVGSNLSIGD